MFPSRALMARSVWKGPHIVPMNIPRAAAATSTTTAADAKGGASGATTAGSAASSIPPVRTQARAATILPNFVGMRFQVHNGKQYEEIKITEDMVGAKLGEFVMTRKRFTYKHSKNK